jgi:hypothetical protein
MRFHLSIVFWVQRHNMEPEELSVILMAMMAEMARHQVTNYAANAAFTRAVLSFIDGSSLEFEHSSRENRWAKASTDASMADQVCKSLYQFRLNAKHLQLFFQDGSDVEFFVKLP